MPYIDLRLLTVLRTLPRVLDHLNRRINDLEDRMTSVEQQTWDQLGRLVGVVIAEVKSLRETVAAKDAALAATQEALAGADAAAAEQVRAALDADSASDVERVVGLLGQLADVVPAEVPDVPVPAPGEPAEAPTPPPGEPTG